MGVEAEIGCLGCKKYIWLGSRKPYLWNGFQIPNKDVFRFLSLHSNNKNTNCRLYYALDVCAFPWEGNKEWQEDINSRSFWDSYSKEGKICGNCKRLLINQEGVELTKNIKKNSCLRFCNEACFDQYKEYYEKKYDIQIYDSTRDEGVEAVSDSLEIGCTKCKSYCIINYEKDKYETIKDYEYFHVFLIDHSSHENLIVYIGYDNKKQPPWKNEESKALWSEYDEFED